MMFQKDGSGGQHLIMSDLTFESPKTTSRENNAVIIGYADSVNELIFTNIAINNVTSSIFIKYRFIKTFCFILKPFFSIKNYIKEII